MSQFEPVQLYELIEQRRIQILGQRGWYDIRTNGALKRWKRDANHVESEQRQGRIILTLVPNHVEIPCKVGFRECFRLVGSFIDGVWHWSERLRETPDNFNARTPTARLTLFRRLAGYTRFATSFVEAHGR